MSSDCIFLTVPCCGISLLCQILTGTLSTATDWKMIETHSINGTENALKFSVRFEILKGLGISEFFKLRIKSVFFSLKAGILYWEQSFTEGLRSTSGWKDSMILSWPAGWGRWFCLCTLLWWDTTYSTVSRSGVLITEKRHRPVWVGPEEGHKMGHKVAAFLWRNA